MGRLFTRRNGNIHYNAVPRLVFLPWDAPPFVALFFPFLSVCPSCFGQLAPACTDVIEHMDVCSRACVCATAGGSYSSHRLCEHFLSQIKITIIEGLTMMCVCALGVRQLRRSGDTRDLIFLKRERKELEDQERTLSDRWVSVCLLKRKGNFFQRKELADERARLEWLVSQCLCMQCNGCVTAV